MKKRKELEKEIVVKIFQTSNVLQILLDNNLKKSELTTKPFYLMKIMSSFGYYPTISEVASMHGTSRRNAMQLALKLEKNGYLLIKKYEI